MKYTFTYSLSVSLLLCILTQARATECEQASPSYNQGEHPFVPVDVTPLESLMRKNLAVFYKRIKGNWSGRGFAFDCVFENGQPVKREFELELETTVHTDSFTSARIATTAFNTATNVIEQHIVSLFVVDDLLRQDSIDALGDIEILELADSVLSYRYTWQSQGELGQFTNEEFIRIEHSKLGIHISKVLYTQGYFGNQYDWYLN